MREELAEAGADDAMSRTAKRIEARRARNRALIEADAQTRCGFCRRTVPKVGAIFRANEGRVYCNIDCLADQQERERIEASR